MVKFSTICFSSELRSINMKTLLMRFLLFMTVMEHLSLRNMNGAFIGRVFMTLDKQACLTIEFVFQGYQISITQLYYSGIMWEEHEMKRLREPDLHS
jgi:hypothetical protein